MTSKVATPSAQATIVLGWYDADVIDAAQVEAILRVLEEGKLTSECAAYDGVRGAVRATEAIKDAVTASGGVYALPARAPQDKAARVAAAEQAVKDAQAVCRAMLARVHAAEQACAWANNLHNPAPFDKAAYDGVYAEFASSEQARKEAVQAYMRAQAALDKALTQRSTR